ncbi:MAG: cytochrome c [Chloroflexota bacterium]|nr:MAG: cytochrome c [Chloroflexota bacterium]
MRRFTLLFFLTLALSLALVACGGDDGGDSEPAGEASAARGEELYKQTAIGAASAPGCITCHSIEADIVLVGPPHVGIATKAETAVSGVSVTEYLEQSIVDPNAVITDGFSPGVMYQNYGSDLTDQEVADLVAFLETLK